jgi:hypothetical protein
MAGETFAGTRPDDEDASILAFRRANIEPL